VDRGCDPRDLRSTDLVRPIVVTRVPIGSYGVGRTSPRRHSASRANLAVAPIVFVTPPVTVPELPGRTSGQAAGSKPRICRRRRLLRGKRPHLCAALPNEYRRGDYPKRRLRKKRRERVAPDDNGYQERATDHDEYPADDGMRRDPHVVSPRALHHDEVQIARSASSGRADRICAMRWPPRLRFVRERVGRTAGPRRVLRTRQSGLLVAP
jgi:hypothetical protein